MGTSVESEYVPDKRFGFTLTCDHGGDLDDGIDLRFGENTFTTGTFDIETEDPERCDLEPVSFGSMGYEIFVAGRVSLP